MSGPPKRGYPLFVHSDVDGLPLNVYAFRVLATIVRRAGDTEGEFFESIPTMAKRCGMSTSRAQRALRDLEAAGLIAGEPRSGQTTRYRLLPRSAWRVEPTPVPGTGVAPAGTPHNTPTPVPGTGVPRYQVPGTPVPGTDKGSPLSSSHEGSPPHTGTEAATDPASEPHRPPLTRRRASSDHPKRDETGKGKGKGKGLTTGLRPEHAALIAAYNEHRGPLPEAAADAALRRRLAAFVNEHGENAATILADGARWAAADAWCAAEQVGLRYLLGDGRALDYAQRWRNTGGMSAGDRKRAATPAGPERAARDEARERELADLFDPRPAGDDLGMSDDYPAIGRELPAPSPNGSPAIELEPEPHPEPAPPPAPPKPKRPKPTEAERRAELDRQAELLRRQVATQEATA